MLIGPPGTGKTSAGYLYAAEYLGLMGEKDPIQAVMSNDNFKEFNASDERGIDIVRTDMKEYAFLPSENNKRKVLLLQEAEGMTFDAQACLKNLMEDSSYNCVWVLTLNNKRKMNSALLSRSAIFYLDPIGYEEFLPWFKKACSVYNIKIEKETIYKKVYDYYEGDLRSVVSDFISLYGDQIVSKFDPAPTFAEEIFLATDPVKKYLEIGQKYYLEPEQLLKELLILNNYQNPHIFAEADMQLKLSGNPMIIIIGALVRGLVRDNNGKSPSKFGVKST